MPGRDAGNILETVHSLVDAVPVFQLGWKKGQNLPRLLDEALGRARHQSPSGAARQPNCGG
jgi:hypothetical protein